MPGAGATQRTLCPPLPGAQQRCSRVLFHVSSCPNHHRRQTPVVPLPSGWRRSTGPGRGLGAVSGSQDRDLRSPSRFLTRHPAGLFWCPCHHAGSGPFRNRRVGTLPAYQAVPHRIESGSRTTRAAASSHQLGRPVGFMPFQTYCGKSTNGDGRIPRHGNCCSVPMFPACPGPYLVTCRRTATEGSPKPCTIPPKGWPPRPCCCNGPADRG